MTVARTDASEERSRKSCLIGTEGAVSFNNTVLWASLDCDHAMMMSSSGECSDIARGFEAETAFRCADDKDWRILDLAKLRVSEKVVPVLPLIWEDSANAASSEVVKKPN